jgi:hypothetical protein
MLCLRLHLGLSLPPWPRCRSWPRRGIGFISHSAWALSGVQRRTTAKKIAYNSDDHGVNG